MNLRKHLEEHWSEIDDYPHYLVSSEGKVLNRVRNSLLSPGKHVQGYLHVTLCNNYGHKQFLIHRLVASAFFDVDISDFEINHIDGDKANNCIWNLEVVTPSENVLHAHYSGLYSIDSPFRPTAIRILETDEIFRSASSLGRYLNVSPQRVSYACKNGELVRGFHVEYVLDDAL